MPQPPPIPMIEETPVNEFARASYLDYSKGVILDRSLTHPGRLSRTELFLMDGDSAGASPVVDAAFFKN